MILEDDVRAGLQKMKTEEKLQETMETDMNKFKSFWGLMSGIWLVGINRIL